MHLMCMCKRSIWNISKWTNSISLISTLRCHNNGSSWSPCQSHLAQKNIVTPKSTVLCNYFWVTFYLCFNFYNLTVKMTEGNVIKYILSIVPNQWVLFMFPNKQTSKQAKTLQFFMGNSFTQNLEVYLLFKLNEHK